MQLWKWSVVLLYALFGGTAQSSVPSDCEDLHSCIESLRTMAMTGEKSRSGMGPEQNALSARLLAQERSVDALIPLLKDPDEAVANLAAFVLRDAPSIDPIHLPAIRAGLDRGLGWLPGALGRIDSDEAAKEAVDRYLVSRSAPGNQEAFAVELSGRRAIPFIVERASCRMPCVESTSYLLAAALRRMGPERAAAGPELMRIVRDRSASPEAVKNSLQIISALGKDGLPLEAELVRESERFPNLAPWIDDALVGIGSQRSGEIFAERLAELVHVSTLRDLAAVGIAGRDAAPAVIEILKQRVDLRAAAATTLGYIGYEPAMPALIAALDDPVDPKLAWAAATSLGRLKAIAALEALDRTTAEHWYPLVRDAAKQAAALIRTGAEPKRASDENFAFDFFNFESINNDLPTCKQYKEKPMRESPRIKLYAASAAKQLARLKYPREILSYAAADEDEQKASGAKVIKIHNGNMLEIRESIEQIPHVALRVGSGWLVGSDRGEWGGELMFVDADGGSHRVLDANVNDIYRIGNRIVATTGLAHLGKNEGVVYELTRDGAAQWEGRPWRILPGAPASSQLVAPRKLLIEMIGGGAVIIDSTGRMRMAECATPA